MSGTELILQTQYRQPAVTSPQSVPVWPQFPDLRMSAEHASLPNPFPKASPRSTLTRRSQPGCRAAPHIAKNWRAPWAKFSNRPGHCAQDLSRIALQERISDHACTIETRSAQLLRRPQKGLDKRRRNAALTDIGRSTASRRSAPHQELAAIFSAEALACPPV